MKKKPALKRTLKGMLIGVAVVIASFVLIAIPVFGLVVVAFHSPSMILISYIPFFEHYHYAPLVIIYGGFVGALLGYVSNKRKTLIATILAIIVLSIGSSVLWFYTFAKLMSEF
jgi:hypothetical protein